MDYVNFGQTGLKISRIDLYQIHRWDYETPIEETMAVTQIKLSADEIKLLGSAYKAHDVLGHT